MDRDKQAHGPSCAHRLRTQGAAEGKSPQEIAETIHEHCSVSLLRAHRLARGLTLKSAAQDLRNLGASHGENAPKPDPIQLGYWETGRNHPKPVTVGLLCSLYESTPEGIGFTSAATVRPLAPPDTSGLQSGAWAGESFGQRLDTARRDVDRTLASASVSPAQLDLLDERIIWARQQYLYTPPAPMLETLLSLLADVESLAVDRQPASVQVRLSELTAVLATLVADALMKLGDLTRSQAWYGTARAAADDSGNVELRARVRAQAAMLPFYYGPLAVAVTLTREARMITRGRPSATTAFAAAAEARALAKLGDSRQAQRALRLAADLFEQSGPSGDADDAFSFPERRFLLYRSGALTALGDTGQARRVQARALDLYPTKTGIDPALLQLETAICCAQDRLPTDACDVASSAILAILPAHQTPILRARAREVIRALPPATRSSRPARELREILALPRGTM